MITGLALGTMYFATGTLWMPMVAHTAFDLFAYGDHLLGSRERGRAPRLQVSDYRFGVAMRSDLTPFCLLANAVLMRSA